MNKPATKTLSFRAPIAVADQVERAARAKGLPTTDYILALMGPWAASDLGEKEPAKPRPAPIPKRSPVSLAAAELGIPRDKFRQLAAEQVAATMLAEIRAKAEAAPVPAPPKTTRQSGVMRRAG